MNMPLNAPNWFIIKHDLPRFVFIFYFCIYFPFHFPLLISTNVFISVFVTCLYAFLLLWANLFICDFGAPPRVTTSQPEIWNEFKLRWILNEYNIESGSAAVACMCFTGLREHENPPRFGTLLIENVYFLLFQHFGLFEERRSECVRKSSHQAIERVQERRTHTHTHTHTDGFRTWRRVTIWCRHSVWACLPPSASSKECLCEQTAAWARPTRLLDWKKTTSI